MTLVRRWLKNFRVDVGAFYQPIETLLTNLSAGWTEGDEQQAPESIVDSRADTQFEQFH